MIPRLHADELSDTGGAALAAALGAASADHLMHISDRGIAALAQSTPSRIFSRPRASS